MPPVSHHGWSNAAPLLGAPSRRKNQHDGVCSAVRWMWWGSCVYPRQRIAAMHSIACLGRGSVAIPPGKTAWFGGAIFAPWCSRSTRDSQVVGNWADIESGIVIYSGSTLTATRSRFQETECQPIIPATSVVGGWQSSMVLCSRQ